MVFPQTPEFQRLIAALARQLAERNIPFMLIGGQAVLLHGEPRLTQDVDITLGVDPTRLEQVLDLCATLGLRPLPEDSVAFVRRTFVLPAADDATGVRVDFVFSTSPYERQAIARAQEIELGGTPVAFAAAEDLILHKLFAGRPRDLEDAAGVVRRKGPTLDWSYLEQWAREFSIVPGCEDLPECVEQLRQESERG